jgi:hypothetical protein
LTVPITQLISNYEEAALRSLECPDCHSHRFETGPRAAPVGVDRHLPVDLNVNVTCLGCGARFNLHLRVLAAQRLTR